MLFGKSTSFDNVYITTLLLWAACVSLEGARRVSRFSGKRSWEKNVGFRCSQEEAAIVDTNGSGVVEYKCDAWGRHLSKTGSVASTLGMSTFLLFRKQQEKEWRGKHGVKIQSMRPSKLPSMQFKEVPCSKISESLWGAMLPEFSGPTCSSCCQ